MLKQNTCIAPFINLTLDPEGNTSPCPYLGGGAWKFDKKQDLVSMWQSEKFEDLRKSHLAGEQNKICQRCWNEEKINKISARQRILSDNKHKINDVITAIQSKAYLNGPEVLTMKNGNLCNLKCRTCGPKDSSAWITEAKEYVEKYPNDLAMTWFNFESYKKNWNNQQMSNLEVFNKNIKRIEHYGGEPFYNPQVYEHARMLVENNLSKDIVIYFNTNATHVPSEKWLHLFHKFKQVEMNLSIDGIGEQFEYIRYPAKWEDVEQTVSWCSKNENNINLIWGIITTVSNLNVYYLPEILYQTDEWGKSNVFLNLLENPLFYCIKNLPINVKTAIKEKFSSSKHISRLQSVLNFMLDQEPNITAFEQFNSWTQKIDQYRKQSFVKTFPKFNNIIYTT
jgi:radical SAM protein with 4Fe4S-binding SPASM domain